MESFLSIYDADGHIVSDRNEEVKPSKEKKAEQAPEQQESDEPIDRDATSLKKAKQPSDLEKEITDKKEFYGPGELTAIAADLMEKTEASLHKNDSASDAWKRFQDENRSHLPVVTEKGIVCGLISLEQILQKMAKEKLSREKLGSVKVEELMIAPVTCCTEGTPLKVLIGTILEDDNGSIPVINSKGEPKGIVTHESLLKYILESSRFFPS